LQSVTGQQRVA